ncbi:MAG: phage tail protein [Thermoanaerobaculia bacterium]
MRRALLAVLCFVVASVPCIAAGPPGSPSAAVFTLTVPGAAPAVFQKCSGIGSENAIVEYRSGSDPTLAMKIPGNLAVLNVTCSRALSSDKSLAQWRQMVEDPSGPVTTFKKNGTLALNDTPAHELARWNVYGVWPAALTVEIDEESGVAMERVLLAIERVERP